MGSKEPTGGRLESAEAASPLWGDMEVAIVLLKILGGDVLHDNLIGHITGGSCKVSPAPYVAAPEVSGEFLVFGEEFV